MPAHPVDTNDIPLDASQYESDTDEDGNSMRSIQSCHDQAIKRQHPEYVESSKERLKPEVVFELPENISSHQFRVRLFRFHSFMVCGSVSVKNIRKRLSDFYKAV